MNKEIVSKIPGAVLRRIGSNDINASYKCIQLGCNEVSIGRSKENTFTIADLLVSRKHAVFRLIKDQWTIENVGMNGVAVNHVALPKHQQIPIQNMDIIEFGAGNKYVYAFRVQSDSSEVGEEPVAKKMRIPLANRNYPSLKDSPEAFHNWVRSKKNLEKTLEEESDNLDVKLEQQKTLKDKLVLEQEKLNQHFETAKVQLELKFAEEKKELEEKVARGELEKNELQRQKEDVEQRMSVSLQEFRDECEKKKLEFEESVARANLEKQKLIEQKELVVQQLIREKNVLQERLEEESRLKEETMNELAHIKRSHQSLEQELEEARRKIEEEAKQFQRKGSEDELRLRQMQEELAEREARLNAQEKQIAEIQELERVREELRVQKELNEQQQQASSKACGDIVGQMESIMENELQCGICSELMVFATSLNCMHTFCQHCVREWKKNKVECPICRAPITTEGRNLLVDNMIDAMVSSLSEETKNSRKKLVIQRQELMKQASIEQNNTMENILTVQHVTLGAVDGGRGPGRPRRTVGRSVSAAGPAIARVAVPVPHVAIPQAAQSSVRPRPSVARGTIRPTAPPPVRPSTVRGTLNRSTAPTVAHPQRAAPAIVTEEVVILSSGSDSSNEDIIDFANRRRQRRRRPCPSCGMTNTSRLCVYCNYSS
ncbi:E3 ubiquitin-protein ligase rnf8-B-like isoform X2 [Daphnia pulex]|uniref:E3 ubiquitin-protein ligase rnf8-B-like isoform X2 n=1 Tax=Daphnia pulex TaxID=6669 RepID=UPI001EDC9385|nr:E3 ubiquitin-protein ligase rnf8-B-like isoform X2 [Daphnia pulex]